jgi:hypothetical protein
MENLMNNRGTNGHSVTEALPKYELIDRLGRRHVETFDSATSAAACARQIYPDQEQDPDRTGKGWDIQVVGAE